jgi:hypothetical protein
MVHPKLSWRVPGLAAVLASALLAGPLTGQAVPKVDSVLVQLPLQKSDAADAVVGAFTRAGLSVANTTASLVEADEGVSQNHFAGGEARRIVRAILLPVDSRTNVLIVGEETRADKYGRVFKRLRIDNRAGGNGGKVWKKIEAVGAELESLAAAKPVVGYVGDSVGGGNRSGGQNSVAPVEAAQRQPVANTVAKTVVLPPGMKWVVNPRTQVYYPASCSAAAEVPEADRFYYADDASLKAQGYSLAPECT